jgi:type I restriction enzyme, R subunit
MNKVAAELGVERLSAQQILVAGMLRPVHLLDLLQNFTVYETESGRTIKKLARYQQFRAVHRALERLRYGPTRAQYGQKDGRGGVIWHTQGSGKSLTMVFLIRTMRTLPNLRSFKVAIVTDRTNLEHQLARAATLTGDTVRVARTEAKLQELLREEGPGLIFGMIQKLRSPEEDDPISEAPVTREPDVRTVADSSPLENAQPGLTGDYPLLNNSEQILVLVDEAHRSHGRDLHLNLREALPNAAMIGFTGTPIFAADRAKTHDIFGPFIDTYNIRQSEEDGSTVPILYEGRTTDGEVAGGGSLDQLFEDMFQERTPDEVEAIKRKYAATGNVLEAPSMVAAKAADLVRHYVDVVMPNGFKAQVVATSRLAAVRYQEAITAALARLVDQLEGLDPALLTAGEEERERLAPEKQFLLRAHPKLETIRHLKAAAVISAGGVNQPHWPDWSNKGRQYAHIARFKKPLVHVDPVQHDGLAFLCVKSMLLTGFDAPVEQVLYLDRAMRGHELLQAIARVNRTARNKTHGLVVDYYGVGRHLTEALAVYTEGDVAGALTDITDELPKLADRHRRVLDVFRGHGIADLRDVEACVNLLHDQKLRAEFTAKLEAFLETLDRVMPRSEARPYLIDAKLLGFINKVAANLYRSEQMSLVGVGEKVRRLIDEHIIARGVDPKIPPISITDAEFIRVVEGHGSSKTRASEMEHAARKHLRVNAGKDPAYYRKLTERLEAILQQFQENWSELVDALRVFTEEVRSGPPGDDMGLDPRTQAPFLRLLFEADSGCRPDAERLRALAEATIEIVDHIRQEIPVVDFWRNQHLQAALRQWIIEDLDRRDVLPFRKLPAVADEMVQLARYRHTELIA